MMEPILGAFTELVAKARREAPKIPYISNVTGTWITEAQATDPQYWATHLRQTVRCADGLGELLSDSGRIFLEVGPGQTMTALVHQHPASKSTASVIPSQSRAQSSNTAAPALLNAVGQLWAKGASIDWREFYGGDHHHHHRLRLPTYPFERKRFWVEPIKANGRRLRSATTNHEANAESKKLEDVEVRDGRDQPKDDRELIVTGLKNLFGELSGRNLSEVNGRTTFIEMGFDSLFLTQASITIEKKFEVRVAFRDLLDSLSTFDLLAAHLHATSSLTSLSKSLVAICKVYAPFLLGSSLCQQTSYSP